MERYKITLKDGSSGDEFFESDNQAILAATTANGGGSQGLYVQRYDDRGQLLPTKLPLGGASWYPQLRQSPWEGRLSISHSPQLRECFPMW
ncbi:hypothetical protein AN948_00435 [Rhodococcus sp. ADH]|nr:hypothetical protein AN948_00435 [Rhodococcus sp. ADH]